MAQLTVQKNRHARLRRVEISLSSPAAARKLIAFLNNLAQFDVQVICMAGSLKMGIGKIDRVEPPCIAMKDNEGFPVLFDWMPCTTISLVRRRGNQPTKLLFLDEAKRACLELRPCQAGRLDFSDTWEMLLLELFDLRYL